MEYAILQELGLPHVPVVTTVHPAQIVDEFELDEHDLPLDYIITPEETIVTGTPYPKPEGIAWDLLTYDDLQAMPVLAELRRLKWESFSTRDLLAPGLHVLFVGINPGRAQRGSRATTSPVPGNHFWRLLHDAGFTPRRLAPAEEEMLPELRPRHHEYRRPGVPGRRRFVVGRADGRRRPAAAPGPAAAAPRRGALGQERVPRLRGSEADSADVAWGRQRVIRCRWRHRFRRTESFPEKHHSLRAAAGLVPGPAALSARDANVAVRGFWSVRTLFFVLFRDEFSNPQQELPTNIVNYTAHCCENPPADCGSVVRIGECRCRIRRSGLVGSANRGAASAGRPHGVHGDGSPPGRGRSARCASGSAACWRKASCTWWVSWTRSIWAAAVTAIVGVRTEGRDVEDVVAEVRAWDEVRYAAACAGTYDFILEVVVGSNEELYDFLTRRLRATPGVVGSDTSLVMKTVKKRHEWKGA